MSACMCQAHAGRFDNVPWSPLSCMHIVVAVGHMSVLSRPLDSQTIIYCLPLQVLSIPDNDQLAAQVSTAMNADLLVLLSDVDGLYTGPPTDPSSRLIQTYHPEHANQGVKFGGKSRVGRGGMESKVCVGSLLVVRDVCSGYLQS